MGLQKVACKSFLKLLGPTAQYNCWQKAAKPLNIKGLKYVPFAIDKTTIPRLTLPKASALLDINQIETKAKQLIKNGLLCNDEFISCTRYYPKDKIIRMSAGAEFKGFKGLYKEDKKICCYVDKNGNITEALMLDTKTGEIKTIDYISGLKRNYSKSDIEALHYYKYHPDSIHAKLRYGRDIYSGDFQEETLKTIQIIENLFSNQTKVVTNKERRTIYRALQDLLSDDEIATLNKVGAVFRDKSFCSATANLDVAKRFAHGNPILEIDFPKDAEYIDMDKLFNIDLQHWSESELLLNKGARFQVIGFDKGNNIIKVRYLI